MNTKGSKDDYKYEPQQGKKKPNFDKKKDRKNIYVKSMMSVWCQ